MSNSISAPLLSCRIHVFICAILLLLASLAGVRAQSTDAEQPTPVTSSEITGRITARDIGDSRQTRHFYILTGTPGDLSITVESNNLDGGVDLFQSGSLRPLAKISIYSGELSSSTTKSIYLRQRETIILRVEARTPNDAPGTYRVRFSGGFEAIAAPAVEPSTAEATVEPTPSPSGRNRNTRRVSSVGARIEEPEPEPTARATTPETSTAQPEDATDTSAKPASTETATEEPAKPAATPPSRGRRRRRGRNAPARPPADTTASNNPAPSDTGEPPAIVTEPSAEAGPKLIIETRDGMRVERYMSAVRRVTVENNQIVVIMRDGKITRHPMTNVLRMAIEP